MAAPRPLSGPIVRALEASRIIGIRAGDEHRFIGVWAVVVRGRAFIRPWNDKPGGWYRAFLDDPRGAIQIPGGREIGVRVRQARGERLSDAIDAAYAAKYPTPGSRSYVVGFAKPRRRRTTLELLRG